MLQFETRELTRRDFLTGGISAAALLALSPSFSWAAEGGAGPDVWVFHGTDKAKLMQEALKVIDSHGGFGKNVRRLALKVNAAWTRKPEQGANTHPALVSAFLEGCKEAGVPEVTVPEHPCNAARSSFTRSGLQDAVEGAGFEMIDLKSAGTFQRVDIPGGRNLTEAQVATQYLEADAIVNMPVAKHHGATRLTMAMKNWMGVVRDRGYWHRNDLHQCIADFSSFIKPTWTLTDATRTMMDHGPQGPAQTLKKPNLLILSRDQVAADTFAATLFHPDPLKIKYLALAREMELGETDLKKMAIHKIDVA